MKKFWFLVLSMVLIGVVALATDISPEDAVPILEEKFDLYNCKISISDLDDNGILDFQIKVLSNSSMPPIWALFIKTQGEISWITQRASWKSDKVFLIVNKERGGGTYIATTADCRKCSKIMAKYGVSPKGPYMDCVTSIWKKVE